MSPRVRQDLNRSVGPPAHHQSRIELPLTLNQRVHVGDGQQVFNSGAQHPTPRTAAAQRNR